MRFSVEVFVDVCRSTRARCSVVNTGSKDNRIADLSSQLESEKVGDAAREAVWKPQWIEIAESM